MPWLFRASFLLPGIPKEECSGVFIAETPTNAKTLLYAYRRNALGVYGNSSQPSDVSVRAGNAGTRSNPPYGKRQRAGHNSREHLCLPLAGSDRHVMAGEVYHHRASWSYKMLPVQSLKIARPAH